ncbi:RNA polymerase sigma factor SigJ [Microbacterium sp. CJ88]|uniref:RNA polymerase sigma factor SigJ n=1 Tax=Microbacterium sp. CJ88 TaxID=3445672 RepID=UPI003F659E24
MGEDDGMVAVESERRQLLGMAYRMLGTVADAEDAVQETYIRWYRLPDAERAAILAPGAWLSRVTARVCLDMLGSARARRERYVGDWLPEPVPSGAMPATSAPAVDPLERVTLDESVSMALLVVLEALTPAERVAFVLHDVFGMPFAEVADTVGRTIEATRQLASSARRHVREQRRAAASRERHDDLVRAFAAACATGDLVALTTVLDPSVVLRSDGGGHVSAARRPVHGADRVARFLLGIVQKRPDVEIAPVETSDGLSFVIRAAGVVDTVLMLGVAGEQVTDVWMMRNPEKLTLWAGDGQAPGGVGGAA